MSLAAILSMAMAAFKMLTSLCGFGSGVLAQFHDANSRQAGRDDVTAKTETIIAGIADAQAQNNMAVRDAHSVADGLRKSASGS